MSTGRPPSVESEAVAAGQAVYSPLLLAFYDFGVLGVTNRFIWKCQSKNLLAQYDRLVSGVHLDVGVGSGYFLDKCRFPVSNPRIGPFDLNSNSLAKTAHRIRRYHPQVFHGDVLQPRRSTRSASILSD